MNTDALSKISPSDIEKAKTIAVLLLLFRGLTYEDGQWRDKSGKVSWLEVRNRLEIFIVDESKKIRRLTGNFLDGSIKLEEWQNAMIESIKTGQIIAYAMVNGGFENVRNWSEAEASIKAQLEFLQNRVEEVKKKRTRTLIAIAILYLMATRTSFEDFFWLFLKRTIGAEILENAKERRVLGIAEHCRTQGGLTGCLELAALGWRPLGTLPKLGNTPCRVNCRCHFEYLLDGRIVQ